MLLNRFMSLLKGRQDYTRSFRQLAIACIDANSEALRDGFVDRNVFDSWWQQYQHYLNEQASSADGTDNPAKEQRLSLNPAVIPRTHLLQEAIEAAEAGDWSVCESLLKAVRYPFDQRWDTHRYSHPPHNPRQITLSCSS